MSNKNLIDKISEPYAEALLAIAKDSNFIEDIKKDLFMISDILSNSKDLQLFLASPLLDTKIKKNIINQLFKNQVNDSILKFLFILVDKRRISILQAIISKYFELIYKLESVTVVELVSAVEFSEAQINNLIEKVKVITNKKNIKLVTNQNLSLIGGFILKIGSKVIDTSLSGKLKQISLYLNIN